MLNKRANKLTNSRTHTTRNTQNNSPSIKTELDAQGSDNSPILHSLEHLELFRDYLRRVHPSSLSPDSLLLREELLKRIRIQLRDHPLAGMARSGDRHDNVHGSKTAYFKVPFGRRRQMFVMLYLNLLTGPLIILCLLAALWVYVPYSHLLYAAYFTWVAFDNSTRKVPAVKRVSPAWRDSTVFKLFRDYFPIRHVKANHGASYSPEHHYLFCYHPHG